MLASFLQKQLQGYLDELVQEGAAFDREALATVSGLGRSDFSTNAG